MVSTLSKFFSRLCGVENTRPLWEETPRPTRHSLEAIPTVIEQLLGSGGSEVSEIAIRSSLAACDFFYTRLILDVLEKRGRYAECDIILMLNEENIGMTVAAAPFILFVQRDHGYVACWGSFDEGVAALYAVDGTLERASNFSGAALANDGSELPSLPSLAEVVGTFRRSVEDRYERCRKASEKIKFEQDHSLAQLDDGSVVVMNRKTGQISNPYAPAKLTTTGELVCLVGGQVVDQPPNPDQLTWLRIYPDSLYRDPDWLDLSDFQIQGPAGRFSHIEGPTDAVSSATRAR